MEDYASSTAALSEMDPSKWKMRERISLALKLKPKRMSALDKAREEAESAARQLAMAQREVAEMRKMLFAKPKEQFKPDDLKPTGQPDGQSQTAPQPQYPQQDPSPATMAVVVRMRCEQESCTFRWEGLDNVRPEQCARCGGNMAPNEV